MHISKFVSLDTSPKVFTVVLLEQAQANMYMSIPPVEGPGAWPGELETSDYGIPTEHKFLARYRLVCSAGV